MLEGEISQIHLIERLVELWREQFTGAIRFENDGIIKIIYFKGGDVLSASTNDRADSIDEILMKAGKVSREHVKQALARRKETETLGDAMLNLGYITRKELTWARRVQVVGVIRSIAAWTEGSFTIVADYLPKRDEGTLFPLPQILVELIVTEQDRAKFERALEGGAVVLERTADFPEVFGRLGLNEDADAIVAQVDGRRSAAEVASTSGRDAFNVYKLLHALATLGILSHKPKVKPEVSFEDELAVAGVADASDMWQEPAASTPQFQFDEKEAGGPTLEMPNLSFELDDAPAAGLSSGPSAISSAWDEPEEEEPAPVAQKMPAWDVAPPPIVAPIPARVEPPVEATEEQWGFDEAQIETARRGSAPVPPGRSPIGGAFPRKAKKRSGLWIALVIVLILAGAGYGGFWWWQNRENQATSALAGTQQPAARPATPATQPTATIAEGTATQAPDLTAAGTLAPVTATSTAPAAPPPTATAPVATPPPATEPLPTVTPRAAGGTKARYDDMARQYAANPEGNFTVQIQILCDPGNLEKAIRDGGSNVWFLPQRLGDRSCYRVFWGRFQTRDEAQRALAAIPAPLRDRNSAVKAVPRG